MEFTKMSSTGISYIILDNLNNNIEQLKKNKKKLTMLNDENYGIGSKGIIFIEKSDIADFKIEVFNKNGIITNINGNDLLCVARYLYENKLTDKLDLKIETSSFISNITIVKKDNNINNILINMGKPNFTPKCIPVLTEKNIFINERLKISNYEYNAACVLMVNPYVVILEKFIDTVSLNRLNPYFQYHQIFPNKINVAFAEVIENRMIKLRTLEKGGGEVNSSGSASCATSVIYSINKKIKRNTEIIVEQKGGEFGVTYSDDDNVILKGNSKIICKGKILVK